MIHTKREGNYPHGEDHVKHKLTDKAVLEIRRQYKEGVKQEWLAQKYGIAQCLVSKIVNGNVWSHLPL